MFVEKIKLRVCLFSNLFSLQIPDGVLKTLYFTFTQLVYSNKRFENKSLKFVHCLSIPLGFFLVYSWFYRLYEESLRGVIAAMLYYYHKMFFPSMKIKWWLNRNINLQPPNEYIIDFLCVMLIFPTAIKWNGSIFLSFTCFLMHL